MSNIHGQTTPTNNNTGLPNTIHTLKCAMTPWNCENEEKQKKTYTMFVLSSMDFFQSSLRTLARAPTTVSFYNTHYVNSTLAFGSIISQPEFACPTKFFRSTTNV